MKKSDGVIGPALLEPPRMCRTCLQSSRKVNGARGIDLNFICLP